MGNEEMRKRTYAMRLEALGLQTSERGEIWYDWEVASWRVEEDGLQATDGKELSDGSEGEPVMGHTTMDT